MRFVITLDDIIDIIVALFCLVLFCWYAICVWLKSRKEKREAQCKSKYEDGGAEDDD